MQSLAAWLLVAFAFLFSPAGLPEPSEFSQIVLRADKTSRSAEQSSAWLLKAILLLLAV